MLSRNIKTRQDHLDDWLYRLEQELNRLNHALDVIESNQTKMHNRVTFMDVTLECHEMDIEYLKANMKTKKKGNK
jgi:hypothetical protein